ncbi:uncharacterized protein EI90DRAFT_3137766 [Cantharellus anzutake]|uniref:uncharacterized protein n=1 Tax=Cantharellus anzutake TaxID=1750568 RepID=UPI001907C4D9|nr:uncharacterized protein EI90DRAFT_3137766 [Cantharellus anzutake]KAF8312038.1 hypothetical protein EI90DRAFT_3137766 [Cantharellus anzutake]
MYPLSHLQSLTLANNLKATIVLGDHTQWWTSACEYIDTVIGITCCKALWSYGDEGVGYNTCKDVFEWLDAVYAEWTYIPLVCFTGHFLPIPLPSSLDLAANSAQANNESESDSETVTVVSIPIPERVKLEMPSAHQHSVGCAASNTDLSPTAMRSDANASPAVAQLSSLPAKSMHTSPALSDASPVLSDVSSTSFNTLSNISATSKRHRRRQGQKKHRSEQCSTTFPSPITPILSLPTTI